MKEVEVYVNWRNLPDNTWYKIDRLDYLSITDKYDFLLFLIPRDKKTLYIVRLTKRIKDKILDLGDIKPLLHDDVFIYKKDNNISQHWIF